MPRKSGYKLGGVQTIDTLCTECSSLIKNHEKIRILSAVHHNLNKTLEDVGNIIALPNEAAEAEAMLKDDTQLMQAGALPLTFPQRT